MNPLLPSVNKPPLVPRVWVPEFKRDKRDGCLEYSVVISGTHGQTSWGWGDGKEKFILFEENYSKKKNRKAYKEICTAFAEVLNSRQYNL